MPLHTSHSQGGNDSDQREFYRSMSIGSENPNPVRRAGHLAMIELIDRLDAAFPSTDIWLLTSHCRLVLMDSATYDGGDWLVSVHSIIGDEYDLSYRMPPDTSPFHRRAEVHATARGIDEALDFIRIAMRHSRGWPASTELDR